MNETLMRRAREEYFRQTPSGRDENGKVLWPLYPQEGDVFAVIEYFGGASWDYYVYFMGTWQFWKND